MSADSLFDEGSRRHPRVKLERAVFTRHVAPLLGETPLHAADLFLACAAVEGDTSAVTTLEHEVVAQIPAFVRKHRLEPYELDELTQRARELLLVKGKLREYEGRGALGAWLRVLVLRLVSRDARRAREVETLDADTQLAVVAHSPEHQLARARWQATFDTALREAFASLTQQQRALFRFQFGEGMTLEQIATVLGLHRATAARHIAAAREVLWSKLLALLSTRLQLPDGEVEALMTEWRSELDLSSSGVLHSD